MSTQLADHGTHFVVSTVSAPGTRRKIARGGVRVGKSNPEAVRDEIVRQAELLREQFGVGRKGEIPVV